LITGLALYPIAIQPTMYGNQYRSHKMDDKEADLLK